MPSHTFAHLGMWREMVTSNEAAVASARAWADARGESPSRYDWHSYAWLVAAHLELGQHTRARQLIDAARALLVAATDDSGDFRYDYANMVAAYVTNTGRWSDVEALVAPVLAPALGEGTGGEGPVACAMHAPGGGNVRLPSALLARLTANVVRAKAALAAGDADSVALRVADLERVRSEMAPWSTLLPPQHAEQWKRIDDALLAQARGGAAAIDAIERWVEVAKRTASSGPAWLETPIETLAASLLAAGRPADALVQFEADLAAHPKRAIALLGAARAARAAGEAARSRAHYQTLATLWRDADAELPALAEVRAGAS